MPIDPALAVSKLEELSGLMSESGDLSDPKMTIASWHARVRVVLIQALGEQSNIVNQFDHVSFYPTFEQTAEYTARIKGDGAKAAKAYIASAIWEIDLATETGTLTAASSYDAALWTHVGPLVERGVWGHIPAAVVIFVEDRVRTLAGLEKKDIGHGLYAKALADAGVLRLGSTPGEWEGWRQIGTGLAKAIGNADRHRIERRADARAYAIGVLGLGSLLLTQIRDQHTDLVADLEHEPLE